MYGGVRIFSGNIRFMSALGKVSETGARRGSCTIVSDDLILAAKRARVLAASLPSPDLKAAFLEIADKWEAEAARAALVRAATATRDGNL